MQPAFPFVDVSTPVELLSTMITPQNPAVLVRDFKTDKTFIITRSDVIRVLSIAADDRAEHQDHLPSMQGLRTIAAIVAGFGFMASTVMVGSIITTAFRAGVNAGFLHGGESWCQPHWRGDGRLACGADRRVRASRARRGTRGADRGPVGVFPVHAADSAQPAWHPFVIGIIAVAGVLLGGKLRAAAAEAESGVIA